MFAFCSGPFSKIKRNVNVGGGVLDYCTSRRIDVCIDSLSRPCRDDDCCSEFDGSGAKMRADVGDICLDWSNIPVYLSDGCSFSEPTEVRSSDRPNKVGPLTPKASANQDFKPTITQSITRFSKPAARSYGRQADHDEFHLDKVTAQPVKTVREDDDFFAEGSLWDVETDLGSGMPAICSLELPAEAQRRDAKVFHDMMDEVVLSEISTKMPPNPPRCTEPSCVSLAIVGCGQKNAGARNVMSDSCTERPSERVHILLVAFSGGAGDCRFEAREGNKFSKSERDVFSLDSSETRDVDGAFKLEGWCHRCGLTNVTVLTLSKSHDPRELVATLRGAVKALGERCQSGDTCFLHLAIAGLDEVDAIGTCSGTLPTEDTLLARLPEQSTLVCLSDSDRGLALLGLDDAALTRRCHGGASSFKAVVLLLDAHKVTGHNLVSVLAPTTRRSADICATALLRAAGALSLADGPCSLSCRDFLSEVAEQAQEFAESMQLAAPDAVIRAYPRDSTASDVRWPIAAAPRNQARSESERPRQSSSNSSIEVGARASSNSTSRRTLEANPGAKACCLNSGGVLNCSGFGVDPMHAPVMCSTSPEARATRLRSVPSKRSEVPLPMEAVPRTTRLVARQRMRSVSGCAKKPGGLPTDLGGIAMALTGGAVNGRGMSQRRGTPAGGHKAGGGEGGGDRSPSVRPRTSSGYHLSNANDVKAT
eukprot:TRINITY_DN40569_c0_g1_i1.p1 TRINITY_DN40569_c0_g1~~TRINITY_DN40569_c0_g1_i1.p1  ORF type:complete len:707 (-),score=84.78 TRINITY_DN40569_c0_g1_i1:37-2157(-)